MFGLLLPLLLVGLAFGQATSNGVAVLQTLYPPTIPPLARVANVEGEVTVHVTVHPDGRTEASVLAGHPMLKQAAIDSATQSHFECSGCREPVTYSLVYVFKRTSGGDCCSGLANPVSVEQMPESLDPEGATSDSCEYHV